MLHLIRTGRVILLLDGYDEMAQFMNSRERRACLAALAELAKDGAKGILTSRPNYFSESEELNVFEALYRNLEQQRYYLSKKDSEFIESERIVDALVERYVLNRYERNLQDLTPEQTESLVKRSLAKNPTGQRIVLSILNRVFREEALGTRQALSGKPVIVSYLLELVEEIQKAQDADTSANTITEWDIYKLIIDRLMARDMQRSTLLPHDRRLALQTLALKISSRDNPIATEDTFNKIVDEHFPAELRRLSPEERRTRRLELFEDLRSSATLTRAVEAKHDGWVFSHNSLREYLVCEVLVESLRKKEAAPIDSPITTAMRAFVASIDKTNAISLWQFLVDLWPKRNTESTLGSYLVLLWDLAARSDAGLHENLKSLGIAGPMETIAMNNISIKDINFSQIENSAGLRFNMDSSTVADCTFDGMDLSSSSFEEALLDNVSLKDCNLSQTLFQKSYFFECDISGSTLQGADFRGIDPESSFLVSHSNNTMRQLSNMDAIGFLNFNGAKTDPIDDIYIYKNHPKFPMIAKICEKVSEQRNSQLRGLTQRGEARVDPPFARDFVSRLEALGWVMVDKNDLVSCTPVGRPLLASLAAGTKIAAEIVQFIEEKD